MRRCGSDGSVGLMHHTDKQRIKHAGKFQRKRKHKRVVMNTIKNTDKQRIKTSEKKKTQKYN